MLVEQLQLSAEPLVVFPLSSSDVEAETMLMTVNSFREKKEQQQKSSTKYDSPIIQKTDAKYQGEKMKLVKVQKRYWVKNMKNIWEFEKNDDDKNFENDLKFLKYYLAGFYC